MSTTSQNYHQHHEIFDFAWARSLIGRVIKIRNIVMFYIRRVFQSSIIVFSKCKLIVKYFFMDSTTTAEKSIIKHSACEGDKIRINNYESKNSRTQKFSAGNPLSQAICFALKSSVDSWPGYCSPSLQVHKDSGIAFWLYFEFSVNFSLQNYRGSPKLDPNDWSKTTLEYQVMSSKLYSAST